MNKPTDSFKNKAEGNNSQHQNSSLGNADLYTRSQKLLIYLRKWEKAYKPPKDETLDDECKILKKHILDIFKNDIKEIEQNIFNWEKENNNEDRFDLITRMEKLYQLMEEECGYVVKYDTLKQIFNNKDICCYLKHESQNIVTNIFVASIFKIYFTANFFELSKYCNPLCSSLMSRFDIITRTLIRYNTNKKIVERDQKKGGGVLKELVDATIIFLDNGIWDFNQWWTEWPLEFDIDVSKNDEEKVYYFNTNMTSQVTNLKFILILFEYSVFPMERIDELIEKLRENSSAIHELANLYSLDGEGRQQKYRYFIKDMKSLVIKILMQITVYIQDSNVMYQLDADNGISKSEFAFFDQKFARVNIINIILNYILPQNCKSNLPAMPDDEIMFSMVYTLGGSNEDPYLESIMRIQESYQDYIYKFDLEAKAEEDVSKICRDFEEIFSLIEIHLSKKYGLITSNEDKDIKNLNDAFDVKRFIASKTYLTPEEVKIELADIQKKFMDINTEIMGHLKKRKKGDDDELPQHSFFSKFGFAQKNQSSIYRYKLLAHGIYNYYMLAVFYMEQMFVDESHKTLVTIIKEVARILKMLGEKTILGHCLTFQMIDNNIIFNKLMGDAPIFCIGTIYDILASKAFTYNGAKLLRTHCMKFMKMEIGSLALSKDMKINDQLFVAYCVEILQHSLENMRNDKFFKKGFEDPYGLGVQHLFYNLITDMVIPFQANQKHIEQIIQLDTTEFLNEFDTEYAIEYSFIGEGKIDTKKKFQIRAKLCYRSLILFNQASSVYLHYEIVEKVRECLSKYKVSDFKGYNNSESGLLIKSQLVELNIHYRIFYQNQVLTNRAHFFEDNQTSHYCETEVIEGHFETKGSNEEKSAWLWIKELTLEITQISAIVENLSDDQNIADLFDLEGQGLATLYKSYSMYILNYQLPTIYKYVRGCLTQNIEGDKDTADYHKSANDLKRIFLNLLPKLDEILQKSGLKPVSQKLVLKAAKSALLQNLAPNQNLNQIGVKDDAPGKKVMNLFSSFKPNENNDNQRKSDLAEMNGGVLSEMNEKEKKKNMKMKQERFEGRKRAKDKHLSEGIKARSIYKEIMIKISDIFELYGYQKHIDLYGTYWGDEKEIYQYNKNTKIYPGFSTSVGGFVNTIENLEMFDIETSESQFQEFNSNLGKEYHKVVRSFQDMRRIKKFGKNVDIFWIFLKNDPRKLERFITYIMLTIVQSNLKSSGLNQAYVQIKKINKEEQLKTNTQDSHGVPFGINLVDKSGIKVSNIASNIISQKNIDIEQEILELQNNAENKAQEAIDPNKLSLDSPNYANAQNMEKSEVGDDIDEYIKEKKNNLSVTIPPKGFFYTDSGKNQQNQKNKPLDQFFDSAGPVNQDFDRSERVVNVDKTSEKESFKIKSNSGKIKTDSGKLKGDSGKLRGGSYKKSLISESDQSENEKNFNLQVFEKMKQWADLETAHTLHNVWLDPLPINLIIMFDNILKKCDNAQEVMADIVKHEPTLQEEFYSMIYMIFKETFNFCIYTNFQDQGWTDILTWFCLSANVIKNSCEMNNVYFKDWFSKFIPKSRALSYINPEGLSLNDNFLKLSDSIINSSNTLRYSLESKITVTDYPGRFIPAYIFFNTFNELALGDNPTFKDKIMASYRFDWVYPLRRHVYDYDCSFYLLQYSLFEQLNIIVEDKNLVRVNQIASFFPPYRIYNLMIELIKGLYVFTGEKQKLKKQLKKSQFGAVADSVNNKELLNRITNFEITQDMFEETPIKSDNQLLRLYKMNGEFSEHRVMLIAVKIYVFLQTMSQFIEKYKIFWSEKQTNLIMCYGSDKVDMMLGAEEFSEKYSLVNDKNNQKKDMEYDEEYKIQKFMSRICMNIEIVDRNQRHVMINFKCHPSSFFLSNKTRFNFMKKSQIDNNIGKMLEQIDSYNYLQAEMYHNHKNYQRINFLYNFAKDDHYELYTYFSYGLVIIINIICIINIEYDTVQVRPEFKTVVLGQIVTAINGFLLGLNAIAFIIYMMIHYQKNIEIAKKKYKYNNPLRSIHGPMPWFLNYFWYSIITETNSGIPFFHMLLCILSLSMNNSVWNSFQIQLIVPMSIKVRNVIRAFVRFSNTLLITFFQLLMLIYIFSYMGLAFYHNDFGNEQRDDGVQCTSLASCWGYYSTLGLRAGGGIGDVLQFEVASSGNYGHFVGRLVFDLFFFILINVLMLNLVQGIIIDSFTELRNEQYAREYNEKNVCFVCGLMRSDFDRKKKDFNTHILLNHSPWKYFSYLCYLKNIDIVDFDTVENDIYNAISNRDISWIPFGDTLGLGKNFLVLIIIRRY